MAHVGSGRVTGRIETPQWSLITVTYNSERDLRSYWGKRMPQDDIDWIVVDNASSDDSVRVARDLGASVISLSRNVGFSGANNIGARSTQTPYLAFVNPDVTFDPDSLPRIADIIDRAGALVAPQLCYPDLRLQPNGRGLPSLRNKIINRIRPLGDERATYNFIPSIPSVYRIVWAMGAALCTSREIFDRIGGWNSAYFVYFEDAEISLRAGEHGVPTLLDASSMWVHSWARETLGFRLRPKLLELQSAIRFYAQYPGLLIPCSSRWRRMNRTFGREWCDLDVAQ